MFLFEKFHSSYILFPKRCTIACAHTGTHADRFACAIYCTRKNVSTVFCYFYFSGDVFSKFTKLNQY